MDARIYGVVQIRFTLGAEELPDSCIDIARGFIYAIYIGVALLDQINMTYYCSGEGMAVRLVNFNIAWGRRGRFIMPER